MTVGAPTVLTITTAVCLLVPSRMFALEANVYAGQDVIYTSEVLPDPGARGWVASGKITTAAGKSVFHLGVQGAFSRYSIESQDDFDEGRSSSRGSMQGWHLGPTIVINAPWSFFTPFVGATISFGQYAYALKSESVFTNGQSLLATEVDMHFGCDAQTLTASAGVRMGGAWGISLEVQEIRHIFTMTATRAVATSSVDGEIQRNDAGEETLAELFRSLEGERFHHSTRSVLVGLSFRR